jgi:hypothetical protein
MLIHRLRNIGDSLSLMKAFVNPATKCIKNTDSPKILVDGMCALYRQSSGYSHPNFSMGLQHTISLWVQRPRSLVIDRQQHSSQIVFGMPTIGSFVIRGPDWADKDQDGKFHQFVKTNKETAIVVLICLY